MRKHAPLLAALAAFWLASAATLLPSLQRTDGRLVYALDDTYIHIVVSSNLAESGTWGIDGRTFASCSSSPLWTVLLAGAFRAFGDRDVLPLLVAGLFASVVLVAAHAGLRRLGAGPRAAFALLLVLAAATPLVTLVFVANEHAMHVLFSLLLTFAAVRAAPGDGASSPGAATIGLLAALTVGSRYEGLFLVAVAGALLAARGRWSRAIAAACGAAAPPLAFGLYSLSQGASFLPSSVLMKAKYPWLDGLDRVRAFLGPSAISEAIRTPELAVLVVAALALAILRIRRGRGLADPATGLLVVFVATALLHMTFARTGEFFRYEAYLVALGVLAAGAAVVEPGRTRAALAIAGVVLAALAARSALAWRDTPVATGNIFEQQYQTATFLHEHYPGAAVAVNDIGLVSRLGGVRCVDLWGLANAEVAKARRERRYGPEVMRRVAGTAGAEVAVVYDRWFERFGGLPREWVRVGSWTISDNVACGSPEVAFYATSEAGRERLASSLRAFAPRLPARVARTEGP